MDSLEARLRFISILKNLQKTLNLIDINDITTNINEPPPQTPQPPTTSNTTLPTKTNANNNISRSIPDNKNINNNGSNNISSSANNEALTISTSTTPSSSSLSLQSQTFNLSHTTADNKNINPIEFYLQNYKDHYEDFHQCLIDTMKKFNVLDRLPITIYYFKLIYLLYYDIDNELSRTILTQFMIPSIMDVLDLILPESDIISLTNLPLCEDMINKLLTSPNIDKIINNNLKNQLFVFLQKRSSFKQSVLDGYSAKQIITVKSGQTVEIPTILNRMEIDRDRHKRSKESNWKINRTPISSTGSSASTGSSIVQTILDPNEFKRQWETISPLTSTDIQDTKVLNEICKESYLLQ